MRRSERENDGVDDDGVDPEMGLEGGHEREEREREQS